MNSYPRMTLRQLCDVVNNKEIYIQSYEDTDGNLVPLSYHLRGSMAIMSMEILRIYTVGENGEDADIVAVLDIPERWLAQEV